MITSPTGIITNTAPDITWDAVPGATDYTVRVLDVDGLLIYENPTATSPDTVSPALDPLDGPFTVEVFDNPNGPVETATFDLASYFVNSTAGNDGNSGLTPALAKLTLGSALTALGSSDGAIAVIAPATTPLLGFLSITAGRKRIFSGNGSPWHIQRGPLWTSGWTAQGGGVYSRVAGAVGSPYTYIQTIPDPVEPQYEYRLLRTDASGTTPAEGQTSLNAGTVYVHLPGDANPNDHRLANAGTPYNLRATGSGTHLTLDDCVAYYTNGSGVLIENSATLIARRCTFRYVVSGVNLVGGTCTLTDCIGERNANDGFSVDAGTVYLNDCEGRYNDDEGASPHVSSILHINGGRYHHNYSAGMTAAGSSQMHLNGVLVDYNGAGLGQPGIEGNGIFYGASSSGSVTDTIARNNTGSGFYCLTSGIVILTNLVSGLAQGNTAADLACTQVPATGVSSITFTLDAQARLDRTFAGSSSITFNVSATGSKTVTDGIPIVLPAQSTTYRIPYLRTKVIV